MNHAARLGLPLFVVAVLIGCSGSDDNKTADGGSGRLDQRADAGSSNGASSSGSSGSSTSSSGAGQGAGDESGSSGSSSGSGGSGTDGGGTSDATTGPSGDAGPSDGGGSGRKFVGNISTNGAIRSDFVTYWSEFTPENEGKWGSVEATQGTFAWGPLDTEYQYTQAHGIVFKEHNFIWGSQQPSWVANLSSSAATAAVKTWMQGLCARYPNVKLIDVVNEPPPHTTPPYASLIGGAGSSGYDWIVNAFTWARAACPGATLIMNDYNNIEYQDQHDQFIAIVKAIKAAGAPIDAVGAQAYAAYMLSTSAVQTLLDSLAAETGLPVYITEYDINLADDDQQSQVMQSQFTMFWNDPNVKGITLWGYVEGATWETNTGLMTSSGTMRPAMTWLTNFLKTH
ncbi:MAG TPA: endo-1,4-beta-xylanase [Polyangiaceae bacterium]|jgi:endo-1,4-beta-xylanase|nr:endo-1,4-beta-xylanase [Polyangiaceae bacterium]